MRFCIPGGLRSTRAKARRDHAADLRAFALLGSVFMQSRMNEGRHMVRRSRSRIYVTSLDLSMFPVILSDSWHDDCTPRARQRHRKDLRFRAEYDLRELRRLERDRA